ncbi:MAG: bifunctional nicotinamidase/pyrazinamidase [Flavobacteriales bacterium]
MKKALIVLDIQNDFLPGGSLAVAKGDKIISGINRIMRGFDRVVATQDWHPYNHKSFATQHAGKKPFDVIPWGEQTQVLWPNHCVQGSFGARFSTKLNQKRIHAIFRKGMRPEVDSYSGFFDNDHKSRTGLSDYLKGLGIAEVYVCGLAGDYCVYHTALDASRLGFKTHYLSDLTQYIAADSREKALAGLLDKGVKVLQSGAVV